MVSKTIKKLRNQPYAPKWEQEVERKEIIYPYIDIRFMSTGDNRQIYNENCGISHADLKP
jgi:hypothetical protein